MKLLTFSSDQASKDYFQVIYQGFLQGVPDGGLKGLDANRRAFALLDKIEKISKPVLDPDGEPVYFRNGDMFRELVEVAEGSTVELVLEGTEQTLLLNHMANVGWAPRMSKAYIDTVDFIGQ